MRARSERVDGQTGGQALTTRSGGRADERTGGRCRKAADGRANGGEKGADTRADGPTRRGHADERKRRERSPGGADGGHHARTSGRADWAVGASIVRTAGRADWAVGAGRAAVGRTGRTGVLAVRRSGGRADKRVGLGIKGHIPRGPLHSWAPSPLASSERECVGCLGV